MSKRFVVTTADHAQTLCGWAADGTIVVRQTSPEHGHRMDKITAEANISKLEKATGIRSVAVEI